MPFVYTTTSIMQGVWTTSGTTNTEIDHQFFKPGAGRTLALLALILQGKASALTTLSGIAARVVKHGTASTAGTAVTPTPADDSSPAASCTSDMGTGGGTAAVTAGATPTYVLMVGCGAAGPGGWNALNPDDAKSLPAGSAKSIDIHSVSTTLSLNLEVTATIQE